MSVDGWGCAKSVDELEIRSRAIQSSHQLHKSQEYGNTVSLRVALPLVVAEIAGLIAAVSSLVVFLRIAKVGEYQTYYGAAKKDTTSILVKEKAEFYFKFNDFFELRLKSESKARIVQWALAIVIIALAFLIVTFGLKNLGIGA